MDVSEAIRLKRAVRKFTDQPLPEETILAILNAGWRAQSSKNTQPWHFIAITGFNISVLAGLFSMIFSRMQGIRRHFWALGLSATSIAVYAILVGSNLTVVRAALMGGLSLFARQWAVSKMSSTARHSSPR